MNLLSIVWNVDPTIFSIGPLHINYYPLLFLFGIYPLGYYIVKWFFKREGVSTDILDPLLWAIFIGTLVGARLGHCLFYDPMYYLTQPWKILMTWEGGLASHGGAIGVLLALWWYIHKYGKKYGFDFLWLIDRIVIAVCFAGAFIRFGNLFNSEIYGVETSLPWGFIFSLRGETVPKHPTQLYEAFSYIILGFSLLALYLKRLPKLKRGEIFGIFLICLFGIRFLIEFIKEPQVDFEQSMLLNMGQWLSVPFIIAGIVLIIVCHKKAKPATLTPTEHNTKSNKSNDTTPKAPKKKVDLTHARGVEK